MKPILVGERKPGGAALATKKNIWSQNRPVNLAPPPKATEQEPKLRRTPPAACQPKLQPIWGPVLRTLWWTLLVDDSWPS